MHLDIISPERTLYSGKVTMVKLPGADGSFAILKNHAPIVAALGIGDLKIKNTDGILSYFPIKGGIVECSKNKIIVLAD
jgi:F-type H+-transporting ATPase subunit epsilon